MGAARVQARAVLGTVRPGRNWLKDEGELTRGGGVQAAVGASEVEQPRAGDRCPEGRAGASIGEDGCPAVGCHVCELEPRKVLSAPPRRRRWSVAR